MLVSNAAGVLELVSAVKRMVERRSDFCTINGDHHTTVRRAHYTVAGHCTGWNERPGGASAAKGARQ